MTTVKSSNLLKKCFSVLLPLISTTLWAAGADKYLNVTIDNSNTDYEWTIYYNDACDDPDDPTDYDNCTNHNLDGDTWSDFETISAGQSITIPLKDYSGDGPNVKVGYTNDPDGTLQNYGQSLNFKLKLSKESSGSNCSGDSASNNSKVKKGYAIISQTSCDAGHATSGNWNGCSGSDSANSTFKINYPPAPKITISLPGSSTNPILNQKILQETYNKLDPGFLHLFDTYQNNPVKVKSSQLNFIEPCTSDSCWYEYCDEASNTSGCNTSYLDGC